MGFYWIFIVFLQLRIEARAIYLPLRTPAAITLPGHVDPGRNRVLEKYAPPTGEQALAAMQKMQHSQAARLPRGVNQIANQWRLDKECLLEQGLGE